jgi:NAD(P)-dependent dehydrogenase (short-subunit alcohol dehydrogenase family)
VPPHNDRLDGRVALIAGGASGIGLACAEALAAHGAAVALLDIDVAATGATDELTARGATAMAVTADVTDVASIALGVAAVVERLGRVDVLVSSAGMGSRQRLLDTDEAEWERLHAVNLKGPFFLVQQCARRMVHQGVGGRIILISSSNAFRAASTIPAYASSKAGLGGLMRSAAAELGAHNITVNTVAHGVTATPLAIRELGSRAALEDRVRTGPAANLLGRLSEPEDVAAAVLFLALPGSRQITGQTIHTSAGSVV